MAWAAAVASAAAQETVSVNVPTGVTFNVTDVGQNTIDTTAPQTEFVYSMENLTAGRALRVSIRADAASFTPPSGPSMAASNVSWTTGMAVNGTGSSGTLSSSAYTRLFQSDPIQATGRVSLAWTLAAPGHPIRAGVHTLAIRWKIESVVP